MEVIGLNIRKEMTVAVQSLFPRDFPAEARNEAECTAQQPGEKEK